MKEQHHRHSRRRLSEFFRSRAVMRKWLNISTDESDYSADSDDDQQEGDDDRTFSNTQDLPRLRRRNSETFRAQYINTKDIRVCVGTWNVGGKVPPKDLDIEEWININDTADIYVLGLQEIVPLNAGNIFGSKKNGPASIWENIIRKTLSRTPPAMKKYKSFSDPPSPSKFKPSEDVPDVEEEVELETDSDVEDISPVDECGFYEVRDKSVTSDTMRSDIVEENDDPIFACGKHVGLNSQKNLSSSRKLGHLQFLRSGLHGEDEGGSLIQLPVKLNKPLNGIEIIGLSWPEPPLSLLGQHISEKPKSFKTAKSFSSSKHMDCRTIPDISTLTEVNLGLLLNRRRRPEYVRIVSKQMIGIFLTIWVRKSLRKHIQNLKVDTVGVGVMGYIGNKMIGISCRSIMPVRNASPIPDGSVLSHVIIVLNMTINGSVSVSMSIYQSLFCFVCTHLTSGEKDGIDHKRNADVHEIHKRTRFYQVSGLGLPRSILDHEIIIWLGDLNYRLNLSYEEACELISERNWTKLHDSDQLLKELKKGCAFDGWSEGILKFPPTYKYEPNSDQYYGEDPKAGRRTPAWTDRILSFGNGIKLHDYKRSELKLSDHRPISAGYTIEVEVFCPRKLQRALAFTDAELKNEDMFK